MTETVDLKSFGTAQDARSYMDRLESEGRPCEYVDDDTVVLFDDEADRETWLELAAEPGGLFERQARRQKPKELDAEEKP